ncbi:arylsulfatase B-like [Hetaerina americana]|uniref:arylsulfatase B-like n=1 Tax=Hetaerina americana TaxID=62018 RepID=UPI003A7F3514
MTSRRQYLALSALLYTLLLNAEVTNGNPAAPQQKKPNIIIMLADDMGWNDVGFHGSNQIPTPNIDALAYDGIILNQHYVPALCTPSRSALLTGKHPIHTGMQHLVILEPEAWGLPLKEKTMPQYLRDVGYVTRAIGKWHLGFFKKEYTPIYRGFDSHYGYWNGYHDYYDHTVEATFRPWRGYDMRRDLDVDWDAVGQYSTDLFTAEAVRTILNHDTTSAEARPLFMYIAHLAPHSGNEDDPLQAPEDARARVDHIKDAHRRSYAAMVSKLDDSVGEVMDALRRKGMLENSIVLFMSDNGAPTHGIHFNKGSNYPLRGMKQSPWEGGVRNVAAIWSPLLNKTQRVSNQLMHTSDWLPTFLSAAGADTSEIKGLYGVDQWKALSEDLPSPRTEVLNNIDDIDKYASFRRGDWKYINGTTMGGRNDAWYGDKGRGSAEPEYDIEAVLGSKSATASYSVRTRRARRGLARQPLEEGLIRMLRSQAEVRCRRKRGTEQHGAGSATEEEADVVESPKYACRPLEAPCLFNLRDDPCETTNLAASRPMVILSLEESLSRYRKSAVPPGNPEKDDPNADPAFWNNTWVNWADHRPPKEHHDTVSVKVVPSPPQEVNQAIPQSVEITVIVAIVVLLVFVVGIGLHKVFRTGKKMDM